MISSVNSKEKSSNKKATIVCAQQSTTTLIQRLMSRVWLESRWLAQMTNSHSGLRGSGVLMRVWATELMHAIKCAEAGCVMGV